LARQNFFIIFYSRSQWSKGSCKNFVLILNVNLLQIQVLVTGSLHLIGGILNLVDPDLWKREKSEQEISEETKVIQTYNQIHAGHSRSEKSHVKKLKTS
jgi:hypothetical protein